MTGSGDDHTLLGPGAGDPDRRPPERPFEPGDTLVPSKPPGEAGEEETRVQRLPSALPEIADVTLSAEIGRGGMGVVYRGKQEFLDREVAVKLLTAANTADVDFAARFQREAKILAGMTHPNVVGCYQAGTTKDGRCYLVMEFVDGPNLRDWIDERGALDTESALRIGIDLARALGHANERGIIHRDVKPENVLLCPDPKGPPEFPFRVKLADLGLARPTTPEATVMNLTMQGAVMGTPATMSPEQFDDPTLVDHRSDIYGLGCVLYHALTGSMAFPERSLTTTIQRKLASEAPDPRALRADVPADVAELVQRMLARAREDRPQTYAELTDALEALTGTAVLAPSTPKKARGSGSKLPLVAAAVAAAVVLAGVGWMLLAGGEAAAPARGPVVTIAAVTGAREGEPVRLEARLEGAADGATWQWRQRGGPTVELTDGDGPTPGFVAPERTAPYQLTFEAVASVGDLRSPPAAVTVPVAADDDPPRPSVAAPAGAIEGATVTLDAEPSDPDTGPDGLSFEWRHAGGEEVELGGATSPRCSVRLPERSAPYSVTLELAVSDGTTEASERVTFDVLAENDAPVLDGIEAPDEVSAGEMVTLRARVHDPEGDPVSLAWDSPSRTSLAFGPDGQPRPFVAPAFDEDTRLDFQVSADDGSGHPPVRAETSILVRGVPSLPPLDPREVVELVTDDLAPMADWQWQTETKTFQASEDVERGVRAKCFEGPDHAWRELPGGEWRLHVEQMLNMHDYAGEYRGEVGVSVETLSGAGVFLRVVEVDGERLELQVGRSRGAGEGSWPVLDELRTLATIDLDSIEATTNCAATLTWRDGALTVAGGPFLPGGTGGERTAEFELDGRPRRACLRIREASGTFGGLRLEGL